MFERSEFANFSPRTEQRKEARRAPVFGSPFFAYFLWRSKESESAAGPRPGLPRKKKRHFKKEKGNSFKEVA
ncbi:hypothetical protein [Hydrogenophaga sp.]|uniref:hypothetical protein n=1 Tax=Hydrogenophaga sp. TaxID=1904254 RepID=UPI002728C39D|nr:hypothetical protein [Hydrogenophaga sp.]MDO9436835.1 hypothetical protein [Hydrogenophaga sp.]